MENKKLSRMVTNALLNRKEYSQKTWRQLLRAVINKSGAYYLIERPETREPWEITRDQCS